MSRPLEEGIKEEELTDSDPQLQNDLETTQEEESRLKAEESNGDRRALVGLQVKDLKGLISEEVAAALRQNTDQVNRDVQKQLEPELRGRLAKAGFLPDLIEAIVKQGNETTTEGEDQPLSNYTRVPTSQLDEATLFHFNVRFKHDILDPNFWIIFPHMTRDELVPMFDHTRERHLNAHSEREREERLRAQTQERQEQRPPMDTVQSDSVSTC